MFLQKFESVSLDDIFVVEDGEEVFGDLGFMRLDSEAAPILLSCNFDILSGFIGKPLLPVVAGLPILTHVCIKFTLCFVRFGLRHFSHTSYYIL